MGSSEDTDSITQRVAALERQNRTLRGGFLILIIAGIVMISSGAESDTSTVIRATRIELVDKLGTVRARLGTTDDDSPSIELLSRESVPQLTMSLPNSGEPELDLVHKNGKEQLRLALVNGNLPLIELNNSEGKTVVDLGLNSYGSPSLEMSSGDEKRNIDLRFDEAGEFGFYAYAPDYDERVRVGLAADGSPRIELCDPKERPLATLAVSAATGRATFVLADRSGKTLFHAPK